MSQTIQVKNKALVLEAVDTLFNRGDAVADQLGGRVNHAPFAGLESRRSVAALHRGGGLDIWLRAKKRSEAG